MSRVMEYTCFASSERIFYSHLSLTELEQSMKLPSYLYVHSNTNISLNDRLLSHNVSANDFQKPRFKKYSETYSVGRPVSKRFSQHSSLEQSEFNYLPQNRFLSSLNLKRYSQSMSLLLPNARHFSHNPSVIRLESSTLLNKGRESNAIPINARKKFSYFLSFLKWKKSITSKRNETKLVQSPSIFVDTFLTYV